MPSRRPQFTLRIRKPRIKLELPCRPQSSPGRSADVIPVPAATCPKLPERKNDDAAIQTTGHAIAPMAAPPSSSSSALSFATNSSLGMPLNPEPSQPGERQTRNLPPKSYAEAVDQEPPSEHIVSAEDSSNGEARGGVFDNTKGRVVTTPPPKPHQPGGLLANGHIKIPSQEDQEQYEGQGQDSSPKSPTRGHRKKASMSSLRSNGAVARKDSGQPSARSSTQLSDQSGDQPSEKSSIATITSHDDGSGNQLTSGKPPAEYEKDNRQDVKDLGPLTRGKDAGAALHNSRIRWAPFHVPILRRLQMLAVLMHTLSIAGTVGFFWLLCAVPLFWPFAIVYLTFALLSNAHASGELSYRNERFRRLPVWSLFASYYPMRLHRVQELEPKRKYIFGYHPHGIISHGAFAAFSTEALGFSQLFPGIQNTLLTLDANFRLPFYREYALRMGMASVSSESIRNILSKGGINGEGMGRAVTIVVGGAREALEAQPGRLRLILNTRKGFIKMALRTGSDLVPVLAFGENEIYDQVDVTHRPWLKNFQMLVKKLLGFTVPFFHARGIFNYDVGLMPYRAPINIVVGKPIPVVQEEHPDVDTVDALHAQYIKSLESLWHTYKDEFAPNREEELKIIL